MCKNTGPITFLMQNRSCSSGFFANAGITILAHSFIHQKITFVKQTCKNARKALCVHKSTIMFNASPSDERIFCADCHCLPPLKICNSLLHTQLPGLLIIVGWMLLCRKTTKASVGGFRVVIAFAISAFPFLVWLYVYID
uniref:Uncharacterized protein n=1 Tax=Leptobrachium leishanense TaxID=445787 RepID=A0A8C5Q5J8_9ANUR